MGLRLSYPRHNRAAIAAFAQPAHFLARGPCAKGEPMEAVATSSGIERARTKLREVFGFDDFRGVQPAVIARVMAGESTLAVMPTGAGKSLTYQLPATMLAGTCVVVSPLIALMHDQLRAARANGIAAATLTSADADWRETVDAFRAGALDLLYVAPERASQPGFRDLLASAPVALFAIDEAHCVSEWGHDFRPDYRLLRPLMDAHPRVPRLALTATADAHTRADILAQLGIPEEGMIVAGFDRPNIRYLIRHRDNPVRQIADLMRAEPGPGIVYAPTRAKVERLAEQLGQASGRPVLPYHAGLDPAVRARNQAAFVESEDMVVVATIAFGMGIDKPDVRFVAHAGVPKSIEAYYQETGRAGGDAVGRGRLRHRAPAIVRSARRPPRRRTYPARCAGGAGRDPRLPPRGAAAALRRGPARALRQLRQLPRGARGHRRDRAGAKAAERRLSDRAELRLRALAESPDRERRRARDPARARPAVGVRDRRRGRSAAAPAAGPRAPGPRSTDSDRARRAAARRRCQGDPDRRQDGRDRRASAARTDAPKAGRDRSQPG
jgi:superfamily II DNA/RNA helicase